MVETVCTMCCLLEYTRLNFQHVKLKARVVIHLIWEFVIKGRICPVEGACCIALTSLSHAKPDFIPILMN
jgi:hypothetical protein